MDRPVVHARAVHGGAVRAVRRHAHRAGQLVDPHQHGRPVAALNHLETLVRAPPPPGAAPFPAPILPEMEITVSQAPRSSLLVRVEVPPEQLDRAITEAVRHLSQRNRVPGFRPGKAPRGVIEAVLGKGAVLEEALDHVVQRAYRDALTERDILPL